MQIHDLAEQLRKRLRPNAGTHFQDIRNRTEFADVVNRIADGEIISYYTVCRCCGKQRVSLGQILDSIMSADDADEFLAELSMNRMDSDASHCIVEMLGGKDFIQRADQEIREKFEPALNSSATPSASS